MLCINKYEIYCWFIQTHRERADLTHTVDVMVDLGLTYLQTKNPDGTYQYRIEPDISFLCNFNGMRWAIKVIDALWNSYFLIFVAVNQRTNELTYSNMQIIAREVELQTMRRSAPKNSTENPTKANKTVQKPKPQNHLQRLNAKGGNGIAKTKDLVRFVM